MGMHARDMPILETIHRVIGKVTAQGEIARVLKDWKVLLPKVASIQPPRLSPKNATLEGGLGAAATKSPAWTTGAP